MFVGKLIQNHAQDMGNNMLKKNIFYFFFILSIIILDRISKLWIISIFNSENNLEIKISSFINLNLIWNKGIAFGLFSYGEKFEYNLLTGLITISLLINKRFLSLLF